MKIFKFTLLWICLTLIMMITWSIGSFLGDGITRSSPPVLEDTSSAAFAFLLVGFLNALLLSILFRLTQHYSGLVKSISLIAYVFVVQFFLTQMETFFFSKSIGISNPQILSILVAGFIMATITVLIGVLISNKMNSGSKSFFNFRVNKWQAVLPSLAMLMVIVYPMIYLGFGYYIAWQSESLRLFYTQTTELNSFFRQLTDALQNGIYVYQILRGLIWIAISVPLVLMLQRHSQLVQYFMMGLFSSLFPATLLFIPNPYMPADVAYTHFIETASSNFLWGMIITFAINRFYKSKVVLVNEMVLDPSNTVHSR